MRLHNTKLILGLVVTATLGIAADSRAQNDVFWTAGDGNYNVDGNWDLIVPDTSFDARGIISNGGIARVTGLVPDPAQIVLGQNASETGSLIVENGGSMTVSFSTDNSFAPGIDVGLGGSGLLEVQAGGSLAAEYLSLGGEGGSTAIFAGALGNPATVSIRPDLTLPGGQNGTSVGNGNSLRVAGPYVNYETVDFSISGGGTLIAEISDAANHSPIKSTGAASLGGTLRVEFNGVSPTPGAVWNLFDVASINGGFAAIDASAAPPLAFGQSYVFRAVNDPGSINGVYGQLSIEQQLVLNVNRTTNEISILAGATPVNIDGYRISSALGGLNSANWFSLQDQNVSDWRESPQGGSDNQVAELKPTGSTPVSGAPLVLGNLFDLPTPTQFGTEIEDIQFEYYLPDGTTVQAEVVYEGAKQYNNLVLVVDPVDGDAILQNQSTIAVSIDGYNVHSDSNSLLPGNGDWLSLQDQANASWRESNVSTSNLTELRSSGATMLSGGSTFYLGSPFKTMASGGTEDLSFQYLFDGDDAFTPGVVVYADVVPPGDLDGDYNLDGVVNAADYTVWRD
ncbi:MAG: hypothetical protein KDA37_10790, partial [Planctomycetales bacterium]|nr:hypothetical protein [Planctomycetales bacterium]